jgi:LPXTG-motif cell wall-anchored protein
MRGTLVKQRMLATLGMAVGAGMLVGGVLVGSVGATPDPVEYSGNKTVADYGYDNELKIEMEGDLPVAGFYTVGHADVETKGVMPAGLTIEISDVVLDPDAKMVFFGWEATKDLDEPGDRGAAHLVNIVLVKFANGGLAYSYGEAGASEGIGLYSTKDSISHIDFGWGDQPPVTEPTVPVTDPTVPVTDPTVPVTTPTVPVTQPTATVAPATVPPTAEVPAPEAPATSQPQTEVAGAVVERGELPYTGSSNAALALVGFGLMLVGAGLWAHARWAERDAMV